MLADASEASKGLKSACFVSKFHGLWRGSLKGAYLGKVFHLENNRNAKSAPLCNFPHLVSFLVKVAGRRRTNLLEPEPLHARAVLEMYRHRAMGANLEMSR